MRERLGGRLGGVLGDGADRGDGVQEDEKELGEADTRRGDGADRSGWNG